MPNSVKGFFEINEDMVQTLLVLEVLFTQDSKVEDLFCGASFGSEPSLLGHQPSGFEKEDFLNAFLCISRLQTPDPFGPGHFQPWDLHLNKLGKGLLGNVRYKNFKHLCHVVLKCF